jgi:hypothetical protein
MIGDLRTFQIVQSVKCHYTTPSYDFNKYKYNKKRFCLDKFLAKNDRYMYKSLGKKFDSEQALIDFCAANYFYQPTSWVGSLMDDSSKNCHLNYKKFKASMIHYVTEDVKKIIGRHGHIVESFKGGKLISDITSGYIHPESYIILNRIYDMTTAIKEKSGNNVIYETVLSRLNKYDTFITVPTIEFYAEVRHNVYNVVSKNHI